ncbi:hypothetical protein [Thiothrix nivea]|uniref:Uncharacterized protein n=1 Tax=Thiothrix nivea (strain ATCC 35100 / DSM 5205 / JP2) TaxID=870187 RepID=A0A656HEU2_THINJ|nr:hypothetical protein [Thiothrix nivea]EIJ34514.1 hypothetical protein Thini_1938 [Thiothrix nivea DSM 5205]
MKLELAAIGHFLATRDYALLFRIASRLLALAGLTLLTYTLYRYAQADGLGAMGGAGHYAMGAFFTFMTFATGKHHSGFNFLFLLGLLGIVATF